MGKTVTLLSYPLWIHSIRPGGGYARLFAFVRVYTRRAPFFRTQTCVQSSSGAVHAGQVVIARPMGGKNSEVFREHIGT